jgi:uncharacterized protein (DUF2164 family)
MFLNNKEEKKLGVIKQEIEQEEKIMLKELFQNQTVAFISRKNQKDNELINSKLVT